MGEKRLLTFFTTKEKQEYKSITLEWLNQGKYLTEIAEYIGITEWHVKNFKNELIEEGKITKDRIEEAKKERKAREKEENIRRQKVLQGLQDGKNYEEIGKDAKCTGARVRQITDELIQEGKITKKQIEEAQNEKRDGREKLKEKVLEMIQEKKTLLEISRRTRIFICNNI